MPFSATVFNVLIASPSDVPDERNAIAQALHEWNALNSQEVGKVLMPVMWETHSAPAMGDRPQGIINNQVVRGCDMLIGAFWTRLGSPTGVEESGTVEEIKWFLEKNKTIMLYYSGKPIPQDILDTMQIEKLKEFKSSIKNGGIQESYSSVDDLRAKLSKQLTIVMRGMSVDATLNKKIVREAMASSVNNSNINNVHIKLNNIYLKRYTEKSFIIVGDLYNVDESHLKSVGGQLVSGKAGKVWNFSNKRCDDVAKMLGIPPEIHDI